MKAKELAALLMKRPDSEVVFDTGVDYLYTVCAPKIVVAKNSDTDVKSEVLVLGWEVPTNEYTTD